MLNLDYPDVALLLLRIAIGVVFLYHGWMKVKSPSTTAKNMGGFMVFIGFAELFGGLAMLLGFLTDLAGIGLAIIMLGAMYKKMFEWKVPFTAMDKTGWELDLVLLLIALAFILMGPGSYSLDAMLF